MNLKSLGVIVPIILISFIIFGLISRYIGMPKKWGMLFIFFILLNLADIFTTRLVIDKYQTTEAEGNLLVRMMFDSFGFWPGILIFKGLGITIIYLALRYIPDNTLYKDKVGMLVYLNIVFVLVCISNLYFFFS